MNDAWKGLFLLSKSSKKTTNSLATLGILELVTDTTLWHAKLYYYSKSKGQIFSKRNVILLCVSTLH